VLYFSGREDEVSALREVVVRHILAVVWAASRTPNRASWRPHLLHYLSWERVIRGGLCSVPMVSSCPSRGKSRYKTTKNMMLYFINEIPDGHEVLT
jgi:hypothetical protein